MNKKGKEGFTLLELMIVVGIIGVLAAISIVKFMQLIDKAKEAATKANLGALRASITIYFADTRGMWPRTLDTQTYGTGGEILPAFIPVYIRKIPKATLQRSNPHPHTPEYEEHVEYVATGIYGEIAQNQITDYGGWIYSSNGGDVRVNCNHRDSNSFNNPYSMVYYSNYAHEF
ncbi:MAG: type II secretion system protein [bacterium]|nr:type II secretion system protein [bacterium]